MKSRLTVAIASLLVAGAGTVAYAQAPQQQTPPPQTPPPTQPTQPMASAPMTAPTPPADASSTGNSMANGSNSKIDHKIKQALTAHGVTATHVNVAFSDGTATLTGSVFTHADIAKAKKAAMGVHGVKHVDTSGLHSKKS